MQLIILFFFEQSISPGLVEQDIVTCCTDNELVQLMPKLKPEDVANALLYVITLPDHVQVHELVILIKGKTCRN